MGTVADINSSQVLVTPFATPADKDGDGVVTLEELREADKIANDTNEKDSSIDAAPAPEPYALGQLRPLAPGYGDCTPTP